ncbi:amidase [Gordonia amarae]|uniref:amidase n=2 Tax=Gordonia amarae TaxID=36821 RepID=G7GWD9_9ACTN|nr:amidase [Gordonia amarae]MCS3880937.1 amidase [Gordonia amarae]QHN19186.1 amidase [Gordonia amarae]QHN23662.1 amidase [Gordonia amarae]QHN32574.1 amidase [Gordonia amarae]QHN41322.1 amidase [Gordonia amarae]
MKKVHAFGDDCLGDLDAVGVAAEIAAGTFSALEAAEAALARIDAVNPHLNAVAFDDRERARKRAADDAFAPGALRGVPSIIKNNTDFAGIATLHGSAAVAERPAAQNEPFTDQLVGTGLNILGASTLPAFGLTASTEFADRPPTVNPWDTEYSCGASSGGSAALVAAGALPIAHANDGGGSIRIPAAACGLVGLKPTRGRVAAAIESRSAPIDLISNGVVTRTVRDSAHFYADIERRSPASGMDPIGLVEGPSDRRLRVAVLLEPLTGQLLDDDTHAALNAVGEKLNDLGHRAELIPMPVDRSYVDDFILYWGLMAFSLDRFGGRVIGKGFDRKKIDPFTHGLAQTFVKRIWRTPSAIRRLKKTDAVLAANYDRFDVVLSPTLAHTVPKIGYLDPAGDFDEVFDRLMKYVAFTPINNTTGTPAISLPLATDSNGLPIGIHFMAHHGNERTLLELAYELEAAIPFARINA